MKKTVLFIIDLIGFLFFLLAYPFLILFAKFSNRKPGVAKEEKV